MGKKTFLKNNLLGIVIIVIFVLLTGLLAYIDFSDKKIYQFPVKEEKTYIEPDSGSEDISNQVQKKESTSPETYIGALKNTSLANGYSDKTGDQYFEYPLNINKDLLYLYGNWDIKGELAENKGTDDRLIFKYTARKIFLFASSENGVDLVVRIDGEPINNDSQYGTDRETNIREPKDYKLIETENAQNHVLEIIPQSPGLKAYKLSFE